MATFQGSLNDETKRSVITRYNFNKGIKSLIWLLFLSLPVMFLILLAFSSISTDTDSGSSLDISNITQGDSNYVYILIIVILIIIYLLQLIKTIRYLIFPCTKKDLEKSYEYKCLVNEDAIKYEQNGVKRYIIYKNIKKVYDEDNYFEILIKKYNKGIVIEKSSLIDGSIEEVKELLKRKISKHKHTSKKKSESNYLYAVIGLILTILFAIFSPQIFKVLLSGITFVIENIIDKFLIPLSSSFISWLKPTDNVFANIVLDGLFILWIVLFINAGIWFIVLVPTLFLLLLTIPGIITAGFILPLKQLTINKKPLSYIALILSIASIIIALIRLV